MAKICIRCKHAHEEDTKMCSKCKEYNRTRAKKSNPKLIARYGTNDEDGQWFIDLCNNGFR